MVEGARFLHRAPNSRTVLMKMIEMKDDKTDVTSSRCLNKLTWRSKSKTL